MSAEELWELEAEGWRFCLEVKENTYIDECFELIQELNLPPVEAAFFPKDGCSIEQRDVLKKHGINTLIQYRNGEVEREREEDGAEKTLTKRDGSQGSWIIQALGINDPNSESLLYNTVEESNCVALTVGYTDPLAEYDEDHLRPILETLREYEEEGIVKVGNLDLAWERLQERGIAAAEKQQEIDQEREKTQKELDRVVKEIQNAEQGNQTD